MRQASLVAGIGIVLVGFGALALVRPWGLRLPRWLVIVPALSGSAYAAAHALTAYVTKPLHALGLVELRFDGWAPSCEASDAQAARSSASSSSAARFWRRCPIERVPGIGRTTGERRSSQARATCPAVASCACAIWLTTPPCSARSPAATSS